MTRSFPARSGLMGLIRGGRTSRPMHRPVIRWLNPAWLCVAAALALTALGVYAIDLGSALRPIAQGPLTTLAWRQIVYALIGMAAAAMIALPHHRLFSPLAWPAYAAGIALLVFLLLPFVPASLVTPRQGARGWIDLGPVDLQPAELAKIAYVLAIARYLRHRDTHRSLRGLVVPGLITAIPVGLITLQPDLGSASLFVPSLFAVLVAAGARLRHLTLVVACAMLAAPAAYPLLRPHQKARIEGMVRQVQGDTTADRTINFQAVTARTLVGAGGLAGKPETAARALVRYNALPTRHNDSIFPVIAARFGVLGAAGVIAAFLAWIAGALMTAAIARDPEARLIGVGFAAFIAAQAVVNIGMNIGLLPIVGVTLPFVSYGGSSMLTTWLMTGLVMSTALHRTPAPRRWAFEYAQPDAEARSRTRPGDKAITGGLGPIAG